MRISYLMVRGPTKREDRKEKSYWVKRLRGIYK